MRFRCPCGTDHDPKRGFASDCATCGTRVVRDSLGMLRWYVDREITTQKPAEQVSGALIDAWQRNVDAGMRDLHKGMFVGPSSVTEAAAGHVDGRAWIALQSRHESALTELHKLRRENTELLAESARLRRRIEAFERRGK